MLKALSAVVQVLLQALLPLLERRVQAAEKQAEFTELQYRLLRQYLGYSDPTFAEVLLGVDSVGDELASPPDVYADHGDARDLKAARLEELRGMWFAQHGELLDDERLMQEYERLYEEAKDRVAQLDPDVRADVPAEVH